MLNTIRQKPLFRTVRALSFIIAGYALLLLMDYSNNHQHEGTICLFKIITGVPCAGCGMGRATLALLHGNISESFSYNILCIPITIAVIISVFWLIYDIFRGRDTFFRTINRKVSPLYLIPFFIITAISWTLNIVRGI